MQKKDFEKAKKLVRQIIKNLNDATLEWTIQVSMSSVDKGKLFYSAQISPPHQALEPITWIKSSAQDLINALEASAKHLNQDEVHKVFHRTEIERARNIMKIHEAHLKKLKKPSEKTESEV